MARRPKWDLEVDVVAVGSGLGATSAAIVAHDLGRHVALLEKAPKMGGLCAYGGGEVFAPGNAKMAALGLEDSVEEGRRYLDFLSAGFSDPDLADTLVANILPAIEYMEVRAGVRWIAIEGLPDYYYPKAPGSSTGRYLSVDLFEGASLGEWQGRTWGSPHLPQGILHREMYAFGGLSKVTEWDYEMIAERITKDLRTFGPGMMGYFLKAALVDRGIAGYTDTPVRELLTEDGRVIGVRAEQGGKDFRVRARSGVVLAIGGYDHNREMARMYENTYDWNSSAQPYLHGDAIVMGGEIGAALASVPPTNLAMFFGYNIPGEEHEGEPLYRSCWECGCPHAILVNAAGERFCDEAFYKDYNPRARSWDGHRQELPNMRPFLIFDQNYRDRYPLGSFMPGMEVPSELVTTADSPRGLAQKLGIDPDRFEQTLTRFNEGAQKGEDPEFGRGSYPWTVRLVGDESYANPNLGPLDKGPYYGVPLVPVGVGINSHGLRTNRNAQVVHVRGHAIPGLYAVGNSAALLDLGGGYQSGTSNMRAITWGYVAGRHLAGQA